MSGDKKKAEKDYYEILEVPRTATPKEIKDAYHKKALQYHPDKNPGNVEYQEIFKQLSTAKTVLCDPNKRHTYDTMGDADTADNDRIDLESVPFASKVLFSFLSKVGVGLPTAVNPRVLSEAQENKFSLPPIKLKFGDRPVECATEKQKATYFIINVTEQAQHGGICIRVHSRSKARFKLLHFDNGQLTNQEDSADCSPPLGGSQACMYFANFDNYKYDNSPATQTLLHMRGEQGKDIPTVFKQLDSFLPANYSPLKLGENLFAVFADNFFLKAKYTVQALECQPTVAPDIQDVEKQLCERKAALAEFESEYVKLREAFQEAEKKVKDHTKEVGELLDQRDDLYMQFAALKPISTKPVAEDRQTGEPEDEMKVD